MSRVRERWFEIEELGFFRVPYSSMCGICGVISFSDEPVAPGPIERACAALRHRGPDHQGVWIDHARGGRVGLGAVRLAVLDPTAASHQPMQRAGGRLHLVYNGEIYNFREIRRELADLGEPFFTDGDTEVVLAACARWGVEAFSRFNGMWALAFYDAETRAGFFCRDRFGIKPLLYRADTARVCFASELRALTLLGAGGRTIDTTALMQHLRYGYIAHPATIYREARRLAPGHFLRFDAEGVHAPQSYYSPPIDPEPRAREDYAGICTRLRRSLADAVAVRRVSDVPIGAFLSGGLDSSIVVAHLAAATGRPVQTFAVSYAGQPGSDETPFARAVAGAFGTEHHDVLLSEREVLAAIPNILDHLGEPVGDSSILPTALLCEFARRHVTVALSGDGGDELFGGYWRYLGHAAMDAYQRIPQSVRQAVIEPALRFVGASKSTAAGNRARQFQKLVRAHSGDALQRHLAWSRIVSPEAEGLFRDATEAAALDHRMLELARESTFAMDPRDSPNRILMFDLRFSLPADMLQKVDLASMMHSLEVRVPFLDPAVVELASSLPSELKIDRGIRKRILADAYRVRLPDEVLDRAKQGFEVPFGEFLRGPLQELFHDTVTRAAVDSFGTLSYDAVESIYRDHLARRGEHADLLFALLSLCWWHRQGG